MESGIENCKITNALRDLVASIYNTCYGAYGSGDSSYYQGEFEQEIQEVAKAIKEDVGGKEKDNSSS